MAIPQAGPSLSLDDIGQEFEASPPLEIEQFYRGGAFVGNYEANLGIPTSGEISIGDFYGANNRNIYTINITGNTANYNAFNSRSPNYFAGKSDITYVIPSSVTISSGSTADAFRVPSQFNPGDTVRVVNNGTIIGRGGNGGGGGAAPPTSAGTGGGGGAGSTALRVDRPTTVENNGNLWAGGGGGGGGGGAVGFSTFSPGNNPDGGNPGNIFVNGGTAGGGGGGGGRGISSGGPGGSATGPFIAAQGGNGGNGSIPANGGGGPAGAAPAGSTPAFGGNGGAGGGVGANGGGGQFANSGNSRGGGGGGGPAGNYITGNPFVTWAANGSRIGNVG